MAVSTLVGTNQALQVADTGHLIPLGMGNGQVKCMVDYKSFDGGDANSTISFLTPPAGSRILATFLYHAALGSNVEIQLGDSHDADRYIAAIAAATAGMKMGLLVAGANYVIGTNAGDDVMIAKATAAAATGAVVLVVLYV